jgi:hypothetical protein
VWSTRGGANERGRCVRLLLCAGGRHTRACHRQSLPEPARGRSPPTNLLARQPAGRNLETVNGILRTANQLAGATLTDCRCEGWPPAGSVLEVALRFTPPGRERPQVADHRGRPSAPSNSSCGPCASLATDANALVERQSADHLIVRPFLRRHARVPAAQPSVWALHGSIVSVICVRVLFRWPGLESEQLRSHSSVACCYRHFCRVERGQNAERRVRWPLCNKCHFEWPVSVPAHARRRLIFVPPNAAQTIVSRTRSARRRSTPRLASRTFKRRHDSRPAAPPPWNANLESVSTLAALLFNVSNRPWPSRAANTVCINNWTRAGPFQWPSLALSVH